MQYYYKAYLLAGNGLKIVCIVFYGEAFMKSANRYLYLIKTVNFKYYN